MTAQQALELHLVGEVLPAAQVMDRARKLAAIMRGHSPTALAKTKQVIWEGLDVGLDAAIDIAWEAIVHHNDHPDLKEGADSFLEKRKPRWEPYTG